MGREHRGVSMETFYGTSRKWHMSFLLSFPWRELSHVAVPKHKGGWEMSFSFVPVKERTNATEELVPTFPGQPQVMAMP